MRASKWCRWIRSREALELLYARAGLEKAAALPKPAATLAAQGAKERTQGVALH